MGQNHTNQQMMPNKLTDHMVTGAEFSLIWEQNIKAYKTDPRPKDLSPFYNHPDYISHNENATGLMAGVYRLVRNYNIRLKLNWLKSARPPGGNLLDYGCGTGDFLSAAKRKNWNSFGVEVNKQARVFAQEKGLTIYPNQEEITKLTYDAITLWHVLEHLENPTNMCRWFKDQLSSKGVLIVAVPNYRSWDAKFYKQYWAAYDVPRHLWHFSKQSIDALFGKDFELIQTHPMWFDAIYVSLLSERYKKNRGNILRGILVGVWSNLCAAITKEPSSIAYVLKKRD